MIRIKDGVATRESLPDFLYGLDPESLLDLTWTDPSLKVQDCAWWPEENTDSPLPVGSYFGGETLTLDTVRKVVRVKREVLQFTEGEIAGQADALRPRFAAANNAKYEAAISSLTSDYPASEIATWERQRAEAVAWDADPTAATPWIDMAAMARGLDRDTYLARTSSKVTAFAAVSAYLTGRRQGIDDQIRAAATAEQLAAVVIDYSLPGA